MATREIQVERVRHLNDEGVRDGDYVLYWMQQAQRTEYNHALEYAVPKANEFAQPLLVIFGLADDYPSANAPALRLYARRFEGRARIARGARDQVRGPERARRTRSRSVSARTPR